ncbi:hypothetical protein GGS20DRAFT_550281 [Poronia punctata]|nr:hypothetical protein GGS20DRAFT_550281 [Poronia punctata]
MTSMPTPALPPPPGVTSNFEHPVSLKEQNNIAIGVSIPLTTIFFLVRVYTRIWIKRTWVFEDWLVMISYIGTIAFCGTGAAVMDHNGGKHEWDITPAQASDASYWFNVASIHYGITIGIAKISILCMYRRVFSPIRWSLFDMAIVFLIVLLALFYTATSIVKIWECVPRDKIFNNNIPGHCIDTPMLLNVSGLFNTITDFIILLLPTNAVWNMSMEVKKKVIVVLVFTFGLTAPAFSLVGFIVRLQGSTNPDKTWVQPEIVQWGLAELTAAVLCVCFPELGPLWGRRRRRGPTTSILHGRPRFVDLAFRKKQGDGLTTTGTYNLSTFHSERYAELPEGSTWNVEGAPPTYHPVGQKNAQGVTVTQEFRMDSSSRV